jgi:hypothetical protein
VGGENGIPFNAAFHLKNPSVCKFPWQNIYSFVELHLAKIAER